MNTKRKTKEYYEQLYAHKFDNLDENDKFFWQFFKKAQYAKTHI